MNITITLDDEEVKVLKKRAKKNILELKEQVEDIIRRSCIRAMNKTTVVDSKCDDKLVGLFSRAGRGRKGKK